MTDPLGAPEIRDDEFEPALIAHVAERIPHVYRRLLDEPAALAPGYTNVVTLHALREAMDTSRDLLNAALRHLDASGVAELSEADEPTDDDRAAAVWIVAGLEPDEQYWAHHIALID